MPSPMAAIRPFRALRPDPARASLATLVCVDDVDAVAVERACARDPRHLGRLLIGGDAGIDFSVADLVRAGVLRRDERPSLTVVRTLKDDVERTLLYAALRADEDLEVEPATAPVAAVAAAPAVVRFVEKKGRIARAMEAETEREPDASFVLDGASIEVWIVDDESAAARIASLLEQATLSLVARTQAAWASYRGQPTDDAWGLACFVGADDDGGAVPAGVCLLPLRGPLQTPIGGEV
jgi:hypothetical protein